MMQTRDASADYQTSSHIHPHRTQQEYGNIYLSAESEFNKLAETFNLPMNVQIT